MSTKKPVVHFEMPYTDAQRIQDFYSKVFGWEMNQLGEEMGNYITTSTTETDANRMPTKPGAINGGFFQKSDDMPSKGPSVVMSVDDIQVTIADIKGAGGTVFGEPMDIPGIGLYIAFQDTEGNINSVLQPQQMPEGHA